MTDADVTTKSETATLRAELDDEYRKRVRLARCFLDAIGVDPGELRTEGDYLDRALQCAAREVDILSFAISGAVGEDPDFASVVALVAARAEASRAAAPILAELLAELVDGSESD